MSAGRDARAGQQPASADLGADLVRDPDLAEAVLRRAVGRVARGSAACGVALGVLALAFLLTAGGPHGATVLPQVVMLSFGQVLALTCAALAAHALRRLAAVGPGRAAARLDRQLTVAVTALAGGAPVLGAVFLLTLRPLGTAALSVVLSLAILAQLALVLTTLRGRVRRAAAVA